MNSFDSQISTPFNNDDFNYYDTFNMRKRQISFFKNGPITPYLLHNNTSKSLLYYSDDDTKNNNNNNNIKKPSILYKSKSSTIYNDSNIINYQNDNDYDLLNFDIPSRARVPSMLIYFNINLYSVYVY